ncbi:putative glycoside hydrolase family 76 protein [Phaeomoniella chlamydospora]|uniref:Putative glycoside hydrolase family 76 protein n=1 Tax=Phaeomoniella chlamydospora TaxID=158046 RepID=A0A0G2E7U5_PHACM|nr:putative glycoside hydrolase family 76 protein [Phaeomoniella chlamydospora]
MRGFIIGKATTAALLLLGSTIGTVQAAPSNSHPPQYNGYSVATDAIEAMMSFYNQTDGRFSTEAAWWLTGNALQATLDYMQKTGSRKYMSLAENTITKQRVPLSWWPSGGGDFRADSTDDTGWWALAMIRMYDLTGKKEYLEIAKEDEAYMYGYWNTTTCGGGIIWDIPSRTYHNAISNELYLKVAASLHARIPGDTYYLSHALEEWTWFQNSGMINSQFLINDGLTESNESCTNNGKTTWTYNQGVILGALVSLYQTSHDKTYLLTATQIANAVIHNTTLSPDGILTEPCELTADCDSNGPAFKGIFVRNLAELDAVTPGNPYKSYLTNNARSAAVNDRNATGFYGLSWKGPFDEADIARQTSALSLFVAAL